MMNSTRSEVETTFATSGSRLLVLCALAVTLTGCASLSTWTLNPMTWFSDDEVNPPTPLVDITSEATLRRLWNVNIGNGQGKNYTEITPAIDNGVIYAASENGNVYAVDMNSGNTIWRVRIEDVITGGVGAGRGLVMIATESAEVIALEQSDGSVKWRRGVSSEVLSAPQTNGDIVVAQTVDL